MIRHNLYSKKSINIIIIISFFMSILLSFHYLSKYDKLVKIEYAQKLGHPMIKSAVQLHWFEADQIITDIKDKKKFLEYEKDYDEFLPQRILALYYYITGDTILDKNGKSEVQSVTECDCGHHVEWSEEKNDWVPQEIELDINGNSK